MGVLCLCFAYSDENLFLTSNKNQNYKASIFFLEFKMWFDKIFPEDCESIQTMSLRVQTTFVWFSLNILNVHYLCDFPFWFSIQTKKPLMFIYCRKFLPYSRNFLFLSVTYNESLQKFKYFNEFIFALIFLLYYLNL